MRRTAASHDFPCQTCQVRDKSICGALTDEELRELNAITTSVQVNAKRTVFFEGDENTYLFNVVSGAVRLSKLLSDGRRQITGFVFAGDFLGLSVAQRYAYTADALTDATLCRFRRSSLIKLLDRFPRLEHRLLELASNELVEAQAHMLMLGQKRALERVSATLRHLIARIGSNAGDKIVLNLPMTREDLGAYAGLRVESVSRCLTKLRKDGIIALPSPSSVHILREEELARHTGD